jgi:hypothetical protein
MGEHQAPQPPWWQHATAATSAGASASTISMAAGPLQEDDLQCPATALAVVAVAALVTQHALLLLLQRSLLQQPLPACTAAFGAADAGHELQLVAQPASKCIACDAVGDVPRLEQHMELWLSPGWLHPRLWLSALQLLCWPLPVAPATAVLMLPPVWLLQPSAQPRVSQPRPCWWLCLSAVPL